MSITIKDVAKLAGVSPSTVSRVLNKTAPISEETSERIYRAMEELKYVPNDIARSFASGSSRAIAIAINVSDAPAYSNSFFSNTVFGIETAAHQNGYNLIVTGTNERYGGVASLEKLVRSKKIDGLILPVSILQPSLVKVIVAADFPCVVLGRVKEPAGKISWVDIDNAQAGANAVRHLLNRGYRNVAFVARSTRELFSRDRLEGYHAELNRAGVAGFPAYIISPDSSFEEAEKCFRILLSGERVPDSVICGDDRIALAALRCAGGMGIRVPEDLGILCFDNTEVTELAETGITAVDVDTFELGRIAAQTLLRRIEKPEAGANQSRISTRVIKRQSTAKEQNKTTEVHP